MHLSIILYHLVVLKALGSEAGPDIGDRDFESGFQLFRFFRFLFQICYFVYLGGGILVVDVVFDGCFDLIFAEGAIGIGRILGFGFVPGVVGFIWVFVGGGQFAFFLIERVHSLPYILHITIK